MAKSKGSDVTLLIRLVVQLAISLCSLTITIVSASAVFIFHALAAFFHMVDYLVEKLVPEAKADSTLEYPYVSVEFEPFGTQYTYLNRRPSIKVDDEIYVRVRMLNPFPKKVRVTQLLKSSTFKGRHKRNKLW